MNVCFALIKNELVWALGILEGKNWHDLINCVFSDVYGWQEIQMKFGVYGAMTSTWFSSTSDEDPI